MADACVVGSPVSHSLSPRLHGYWLKQYGIDAAYTAQEITEAQLAGFVEGLRRPQWAGCNVTVPHKQAIIPHLDALNEEAQRIGAVNTVVVTPDGRRLGLNTDSDGFRRHLELESPQLEKRKAVLLGAGGAARAALAALADMGFIEILLVNRTPEKARELAAVFGKPVQTVSWQEREEVLQGADLLVNTTSLGLKGGLPLEINLSRLPLSATVYDIVYNPLETALLAQARARGNRTVDGLGMLLHQAAPAFHAWFGVMPEVTPELRRVMLDAYAG